MKKTETVPWQRAAQLSGGQQHTSAGARRTRYGAGGEAARVCLVRGGGHQGLCARGSASVGAEGGAGGGVW